MKIAILVSEKYAKEHYIDDELLCDALQKENLSAEIIAWDDDDNVLTCDGAIIRSCWDYHDRKDEFIEKLEKYSKYMPLFNSLETVKWNADKKYLSELSSKLKTVKTALAKNVEELETILKTFNEDRLVLKPTVSASGMNTFCVAMNNTKSVFESAQKIFTLGKNVLVQKYIDSVENKGERSIIVINGKCTYVYTKHPANGGFLVHNHWGGHSKVTDITQTDKAITKKVIGVLKSRFNETPLYMRIDLLYDAADEPMLLELELIEPGLSLSHCTQSLKELVLGIKKRLLNNCQ